VNKVNDYGKLFEEGLGR